MDNSDFMNIATGIISAVIILILNFFYKNHLLPFYKKHVYKGVDISGAWKIKRKKTAADGKPIIVLMDSLVTLTQISDELEGTSTSTNPNDKSIISYIIKGNIKDRIVYLTFYNTDNSNISYQNFLLEVKKDATVMIGYNSFYGLIMSKIRSVNCIFEKV